MTSQLVMDAGVGFTPGEVRELNAAERDEQREQEQRARDRAARHVWIAARPIIDLAAEYHALLDRRPPRVPAWTPPSQVAS